MKKRNLLERIYSSGKPADIPWVREPPPRALVELIEERNKIPPGKAVDLGCGTGHSAIWLASLGFNVTGIDVSPSAIREARRNAEEKDAGCSFLAADVLGDLAHLEERFDFAYNWHLLHHIYPEERPAYAANVFRLLRPGGRHLSVCFCEQDPQFGGSGKYRKTSMGTVLYFSSEDEIRELFAPHFRIEELKTIETEGKSEPHLSVWALMTKP
jgi:SAM-dependent methyltransferase